MSEYVRLVGTEEVSRAASSMRSSADTMRQAASSIHEAIDFNLRQQIDRLDEIFDRHVTRLEELVARDEAVVNRLEELHNESSDSVVQICGNYMTMGGEEVIHCNRRKGHSGGCSHTWETKF